MIVTAAESRVTAKIPSSAVCVTGSPKTTWSSLSPTSVAVRTAGCVLSTDADEASVTSDSSYATAGAPKTGDITSNSTGPSGVVATTAASADHVRRSAPCVMGAAAAP